MKHLLIIGARKATGLKTNGQAFQDALRPRTLTRHAVECPIRATGSGTVDSQAGIACPLRPPSHFAN